LGGVYSFVTVIIDTFLNNLTMLKASRADVSVRMYVSTTAIRSVIDFKVV
jgi:hypothetical protein